jgi:hypothetical protein
MQIGFEGWNKNQKFTNYIQWKHDLLQSLPPISADSRRAAELMRRQVQFSANPYVSLMSL